MILSDGFTCLSRDKTIGIAVHNQIDDLVYSSLSSLVNSQVNCGEGIWYRVADLNMTDLSQHCPPSSGWQEVISDQGIRGCQKLSNASDSGCQGIFFPINRRYSKVCGRATGYQIGGTAAFGFISLPNIDTFYHYGISVTHGMPCSHIWSFAIGLSDGASYKSMGWECPCNMNNVNPPPFVGDNYFCESGNPTTTWVSGNLYGDDPLWDGRLCESEGQCCSTEYSPPWFSVNLPSPTVDDIEVRLCIPTDSPGEGMILQKLEMYIQ